MCIICNTLKCPASFFGCLYDQNTGCTKAKSLMEGIQPKRIPCWHVGWGWCIIIMLLTSCDSCLQIWLIQSNFVQQYRQFNALVHIVLLSSWDSSPKEQVYCKKTWGEALYIYLHFHIIATLFVYFLACHPYMFLHF